MATQHPRDLKRPTGQNPQLWRSRRTDTSHLRRDDTDPSSQDTGLPRISVVAKVIPGREQAIRDYGKKIEEAVKADPFVLAPLRLHYLAGSCSTSARDCISMYQASSIPISTSTSRTRGAVR